MTIDTKIIYGSCWPEIIELVEMIFGNEKSKEFYEKYGKTLDSQIPLGIPFVQTIKNAFYSALNYEKTVLNLVSSFNSLKFFNQLGLFISIGQEFYLPTLENYSGEEKLLKNSFRKLLPIIKNYLESLKKEQFFHYLPSKTKELMLKVCELFNWNNIEFLSKELIKLHIKVFISVSIFKIKFEVVKDVNSLLEKFCDEESVSIVIREGLYESLIKNQEFIKISNILFQKMIEFNHEQTLIDSISSFTDFLQESQEILNVLANLEISQQFSSFILDVLLHNFVLENKDLLVVFSVKFIKAVRDSSELIKKIVNFEKFSNEFKIALVAEILNFNGLDSHLQSFLLGYFPNQNSSIYHEISFWLFEKIDTNNLFELDANHSYINLLIEELKKSYHISTFYALGVFFKKVPDRITENHVIDILKSINHQPECLEVIYK